MPANSHNTLEAANPVVPEPFTELAAEGGSLSLRTPAKSILMIETD